MRNFIIRISAFAKAQKPDFAVIPQNGIELITTNGLPTATLERAYLDAIDGHGQESLFFGEPRDNRETDIDRSNYLISRLNVSKENGNAIIVTDYCTSKAKVTNPIESNLDLGYISFAADDRNLRTLPKYPEVLTGENTNDINTISEAQNHLYLLNYSRFSSKSEFLENISSTNYDMIIMDAFFNDMPFTADEINQLKSKQNGGKRQVISYMSIGEAEDYRYYWNADWEFNAPDWLGEENGRWPGNYKVEYWNTEWQDLIIGSQDTYLGKILEAGFDGVYQDLVDAFNHLVLSHNV